MNMLITAGLLALLVRELIRREQMEEKLKTCEENIKLRELQSYDALVDKQEQIDEQMKMLKIIRALPSFQLMRLCLGETVADEIDQNMRLMLLGAITPDEFNSSVSVHIAHLIWMSKNRTPEWIEANKHINGTGLP